MATIRLQDVSKVYPNGHTAVRQLTLDVENGELLVLVGPSGCGKSTVLRLIAGLETPSSGRILIGERDVTREPPQRRDIAMVFQSYALYPHKSVRENLAFALRVQRMDPADIDARVKKTAAALGLDTLLDRKPGQLSGGQRQRTALGRAIIREPQAFLLDEPLSNLDPVLRLGTRTELALLHRRLNTTTIYVTHDQEEAMTLGTRVAVMRHGIVEQVAAPLEIFRRPANVFVASFVGAPAMNLWPATIERTADLLRIVSPMCTVDLSGPDITRVKGGSVTIGVRPHEIDLVAEREADGSGRVEIVEPLGATTIVHLRVDGLQDQLVRAVVPVDTAVQVNELVHFRLRRNGVHLFDADRGAACFHTNDRNT
jgi:multiple sugar transport system ATP-binding protein